MLKKLFPDATDPAEGNLCDAQIGRNIPQFNAVGDVRCFLQQFFIALLGRLEQAQHQAILDLKTFQFSQPSAPIGNLDMRGIELLQIFNGQAVQLGVFQCLEVFIAGLLKNIAVQGNQGFSRKGKTQDHLLFQFVVVNPTDAFFLKVQVMAVLIRFDEDLIFRDFDHLADAVQQLELLLGKRLNGLHYFPEFHFSKVNCSPSHTA